MTPLAPPLYNRPPKPALLNMPQRLTAFFLALGSLSVLITACLLTPNAAGIGTHRQMGMAPCNFQTQFGLPCPTCGMTTSFAFFVRGNFIASFYVQPMGLLLALFTFLLFWFAAFEAITGKNFHALFGFLPVNKLLWFSLALFVIAWAWKIGIQLTHHDGWTPRS